MLNLSSKANTFFLSIILISINVSICILIKASDSKHAPSINEINIPAPTLKSSSSNHLNTVTLTVQPGDTFSSIMHRNNISKFDENLFLSDKKILQHIDHLHVGEKLYLTLSGKNLSSLSYFTPENTKIELQVKHKKIFSHITSIPLVTSVKLSTGIISTSLGESAKRNHIAPEIVKQFENIFKGTINFSRDIHKNDSFEILYNELYKNGLPYKTGKVLLAKIHSKGKTHTAILFNFANKSGYYSPNGKGIQPLFLMYPLHFKRISSLFSLHRLDPITHHVQPHYGVDLAAPTGTPIHAIGDGIITYKGWERGYGNTIKIRYNQHDLSLYAHLSHYAKVHEHEHVKKGQVVGYVGMTGWATGPHLHFGWYVDGTPVDPLKRKIEVAPAIPHAYRSKFIHKEHYLLSEYNLLKNNPPAS